jgi:hypothetical protein
MFLDLLGKTTMRDVGQSWGQWFVFFSYCIVASTLGAEFIAPVVSGFRRLLQLWAREVPRRAPYPEPPYL